MAHPVRAPVAVGDSHDAQAVHEAAVRAGGEVRNCAASKVLGNRTKVTVDAATASWMNSTVRAIDWPS